MPLLVAFFKNYFAFFFIWEEGSLKELQGNRESFKIATSSPCSHRNAAKCSALSTLHEIQVTIAPIHNQVMCAIAPCRIFLGGDGIVRHLVVL